MALLKPGKSYAMARYPYGFNSPVSFCLSCGIISNTTFYSNKYSMRYYDLPYGCAITPEQEQFLNRKPEEMFEKAHCGDMILQENRTLMLMIEPEIWSEITCKCEHAPVYESEVVSTSAPRCTVVPIDGKYAIFIESDATVTACKVIHKNRFRNKKGYMQHELEVSSESVSELRRMGYLPADRLIHRHEVKERK